MAFLPLVTLCALVATASALKEVLGTGPTKNTCNSKYNYDDVLYKSILFYDAQRSGKLPQGYRIQWRGDSLLNDRITGGWYDAGDFIKFNFPMAYSTTTLAWGLIDYKNAYTASGQYENMLKSIQWPLDYFVRCHTGTNEVYVQVGDSKEDHRYWGPPEKITYNRPAYRVTESNPGSDVVGEMAAALAAGYIVFKDENPTLAASYLKHAKELYTFASQHKGQYHNEGRIPTLYRSSGFEDELAWAAAWLYRATQDDMYKNEVNKYFSDKVAWAFSWDSKTVGYQLLMYQLTKEDKFKAPVEGFLNSWQKSAGIPYTPKGLVFRNRWGSLRYAMSGAFIGLKAADNGIGGSKYRDWAMGQIGYALGDTGRSFVVGFGTNPPRQPHHRAASCQGLTCTTSGAPNPHILYGALVGGPGRNDDYVDRRSDYVKNEVACDYNAAFQSAIAAVISQCVN